MIVRWWFLVLLSGCGFETVVTPPGPRPIAPLSTSTVGSRRPSLHWVLPQGISEPAVELCRARACDHIDATATIDSAQVSAVPDAELAPGLWYWRVRASTPDGPGVSPTWMFTVPTLGGPRDSRWGSVLDLDGDGHPEVAISAGYAQVDSDINRIGRVYVYRGTATGPDRTAVTVLDAPADAAYFGKGLAACDMNGDGYPDLVVGAPRTARGDGNNRGRIYLYRGGPTGIDPAAPPQILDIMFAHELGWSLACAGDVNGDGFGDLVVGAPLTARAGMTLGAGMVYIFYGASDRITLVSKLVSTDVSLSKFGVSVAGPGDLDGDGYDDVVIGAPDAQRNGMPAGRVYIVRGRPSGPAEGDLELLENPIDNMWTRFGNVVSAAGDLDLDGFPDFVVGAPDLGAGRIHVYRGGLAAGMGATLVRTIDGPDGDMGRFGQALSGGSDTDGDGRSDVVVGANCAPTQPNVCGAGRAYLLHGDATQFLVPGPVFTGAAPDHRFGETVSIASDLDGDGRADLVSGGALFMAELGRVDVFLTGSADPSKPSLTLVGSDRAGQFGTTVACGLPRRRRGG